MIDVLPKFRLTYPSILFLLGFLFNLTLVHAQAYSISGHILAQKDGEQLIGANILLLRLPDSTQVKGAVSDIDGSYRISGISPGTYLQKVSYLGFHTEEKRLSIQTTNIQNFDFHLKENTNLLQETQINAIMPRMTVQGDTVMMNADAFKVNPDADASDLVKKMPGILIQNGKVQAQGEDVKRVLVDGKEFFGDDALMTLKNLPAEIVDKVQIYDKLSDQASFSGYDDGNTEKTLNIVTRQEIKDGIFGRVYAGYGTDKRYNLGGNFNYFKDARRLSILELSNNVNIQNFNNEDLVGVASGSSSRAKFGKGGRQFGGGQIGNFLTPKQGGINHAHGVGVNFVDEWKKGVELSASYFFNRVHNENISTLNRAYLTEDYQQNYFQSGVSESYSTNHRFNAKIEYDINDRVSLDFKPQFSIQNYHAESLLDALISMTGGDTLSKSNNQNQSQNHAYNLSNDILFKHKLKKDGRTYSLKFTGGYNNRQANGQLTADNIFSHVTDSLFTQNQITNGLSKSLSLEGDIKYTEPIGKNASLILNYEPTYVKSTSDKMTYQYDSITNSYQIIDIQLSNIFENINIAHNAGVGFRYNYKNVKFNIGVEYQNTSLKSDRTFPGESTVNKQYNNVLPSVQVRFKKSKSNNFKFFYQTNVHAPNISQLQDVIDNSNPLILSGGNKDLNQQYTHSVGLNWRYAIPQKGRSVFVFMSGSVNRNYITNSTLLAQHDTLLPGGIILPAGGQFTRPVNVNGNWNFRSFFAFGTPLLALKSNLNISGGMTYNKIPNYVNDQLQFNKTFDFNGNIFLGSNISERVDFSWSYQATYHIVKYLQAGKDNNNYYQGVAGANLSVLPWKGLVINSDVKLNHYIGLGSDYNQNITLWNASIGYKFLKKQSAQFSLQVFDLLGTNKSINRTITETYIEDSRVNVLSRYFMLQFTYKFNRYNTDDTSKNSF